MDKKKIGELDGTPIVTGKKNYANEHEYYLTMNEDNTYRKLEQRVSGDKFKLVLGGGGNDYPTPTAGDVNKVWQVTPVQKGTKTEETVIVPELTLVNGQELEYNDKFVPGVQCIAIVNGVEYRGKIINQDDFYIFSGEFGRFEYESKEGLFFFYSETEYPEEATVSLSVIEEVPDYDYNWAPGVKIPIPTAEDEGKILVVTKVEGDNISTIVPEQEVPADNQTPLTDVDLKYFVPGNTVTATVTIQQTTDDEPVEAKGILLKGSESSNSETLVVSGIIYQLDFIVGVSFNEGQKDEFYIGKFPYSPLVPDGPKLLNTKSSTDTEYVLVTNLYEIIDSMIDSGEGSDNLRGNTISSATIKLEYSESNYEYQLQENSGSDSGSTGNGGNIKLYKSVNEGACMYDPFTPKAGDIIFFGFQPDGYNDDDPAWVYPAIIKEFNETTATGTAMAFTAYVSGRTHSVQGISEPVLDCLDIDDPTNIPINPTRDSGIVIGIAPSLSDPDTPNLAIYWRNYVA